LAIGLRSQGIRHLFREPSSEDSVERPLWSHL
jgi:hypothetical protein